MRKMHRYLIRLSNLSGHYKPSNTIQLLVDLRKQVDEFRSVIKNLRVTDNAIEFDMYVSDEESKERSLLRLTEKVGVVLTERDLEVDDQKQEQISETTKIEVMERGIRLFNEERYWECHEAVEQIWRKEQKGKEKEVQQGFILAASALVHFQRHEDSVCMNMIPRALAKLDSYSGEKYYGLQVAKLKENLDKILNSNKVLPFKI